MTLERRNTEELLERYREDTTAKTRADRRANRRKRLNVLMDKLRLFLHLLRGYGGWPADPCRFLDQRLPPLLLDLDDLTDLIAVLRSGHPIKPTCIEIETSTSRATRITDLHSLTDREFKEGFTIFYGQTNVILQPERTRAAGPAYLVKAVQENWAEYRRTKAWPSAYTRLRYYYAIFGTTFVVYLLVMFIIHNEVPQRPGLAWIYFAIISIIAASGVRDFRGGAVLYPGTRTQRKQDLPLRRRYRLNIFLSAIGSILVPLLALLVSTLITRM